ncbi:MAG: SPOR domain-containing protein, partial [Rhodospirillales bacterium]|nr:SPOR domain-containing protein [Rhodospirillales bacterium]
MTSADEQDGREGPFPSEPLEPLEFEPILGPSSEEPKGRGFRMVIIGLVLLGGVALAGWFMLAGSGSQVAEGNLPVVRAPETPFKVRPEKPGGMEIPNQDKLVYERIDPKATEPAVERLLPPSEKPLPPPEAQPSVETGASEMKEATEITPQATPEPPQPPQKAEAVNPSSSTATQPDPAPIRDVAKPAAPAAPPPVAANASGSAYRVQLAAVRSESAATAEWNRLKQKHAALFAGMEPDLEKADLGAKGVFYRLRAGPLNDEA